VDERGPRDHRVELAATILLAFAAVATAWSTFQAGRWRGDQAAHTSRAQQARTESAEASTRAGQLAQVDVGVFIQWVNARAAGNQSLAAFYRRRFRREFRPAFAAWIATKPLTSPTAPSSPFVMPQYRLGERAQADRLAAKADRETAGAAHANSNSDDYLLALVLFASSLFFAGISTKLRSIRQREVLLAIGLVLFVGCVVWIATRPVTV
jgi:hypothetical protein